MTEYTRYKYWKEMGIPDHLACLFRNLYAGEAWHAAIHGVAKTQTRLSD